MPGSLIGYARCSTDQQDLTAQRDRLHELGLPTDRIYLDYADGRVMPMPGRIPLARKVNGLDRSA